MIPQQAEMLPVTGTSLDTGSRRNAELQPKRPENIP
jgi:hypothetical protein